MFYRVTARLKTETASELHRKLSDGTIENQNPDGGEIVGGMNRAVLNDDGTVEFSMACYCSTPLAHERATVFDQHFDTMTTEVVEGYQEHAGRSFMQYLAELASGNDA